MEPLLASGEEAKGFWDIVVAWWPAIATGLSAILASIALIIRQLWFKIDKWMEHRHQIAEIVANAEAAAKKLRAEKEAKTLETLTETLPMIADANSRLVTLTEKSNEKASDIIKTQVGLHGAFIDLADCMVLNACPDVKERFAKDVERVKGRVKSVSPAFRGDKGDKGDRGEKGDKGETGDSYK